MISKLGITSQKITWIEKHLVNHYQPIKFTGSLQTQQGTLSVQILSKPSRTD